MLEEYLPKKKIGLFAPLQVIDYFPYMFYRLAPDGIMLVMLSVGLRELTPKDVERVFAPLEEYLDKFVEQKVDIIVQTGVPLPILMGVDAHDKLLARIQQLTGLPATSQVPCVIAAAKALGIRNIALVNKWDSNMNKVLSAFFTRDGIRIVGITSRAMVLSQSLKLQGRGESLSLAYELGREAFKNYPDADGIFIGGGSWLTLPVVDPLEKEFGKPVITNFNATIWHVCHLIDYWKPIQGYGRLLQIM